MSAYDRYQEFLRTDVNDPLVAREIKLGMRQSDGQTDIQVHLPTLFHYSYGNVLEIGTRFGASTSALLAGVQQKGGHLYSVDINDCSSLYPGHWMWTFIQRDSKDTEYLNQFIPKALDLLFIDGDHTFEGVLKDLLNFGPRSRTILIHDAATSGSPGVIQAIHAYISQSNCPHKHCEIITGSHGLAVLQ